MANLTGISHPYYPPDAKISGYLPNDWTTAALLASFATACTIVFSFTFMLLKMTRLRLSKYELLTTMWFVLCGCIHLFFEGFFVANNRILARSQHPIGQMWKEYALSDSRYLTGDVFVLCIEASTVICWGPLSFTVAGLIATNHPLKLPLQALVSLGQLYGDTLYYATSMYDYFFNHISYSRPEPVYFWVYYFLMNSFWIIIPAMLLFDSVASSRKAFEELKRLEGHDKSK